MTDEQKNRAERNKVIFDRAISIIMREWEFDRNKVLEWLCEDENWDDVGINGPVYKGPKD